MLKKIIRFILLIGMVFVMARCTQSSDKVSAKENKIITAKLAPLTTSFFYSGVVQPLKTILVASPTEGMIQEVAFHYGDSVKKDQLLFTIYSDKFQTDYKAALMQYIKTKVEFNNAQSQLTEAEFLHKNELISDDDYKSKHTTFYTSQLSLIQSEDSLKALLQQLDTNKIDFHELTIENIDKITQALRLHDHSQKIKMVSPADGVVLLPIREDTQPKKLAKGELVKQGEVLVMVGDVGGLTIHINVNEFNINQLKIGQQVIVTGTAFSQFKLKGEILNIDKQGEASSGGGSPVFPVEIVVPTLTKEQQAVIHTGMSSKVEIKIESDPVIAIPIASVFEKMGMPHVKLKTESGFVDRPVKTGETTADAVVIESNVKEGDQIVVVG